MSESRGFDISRALLNSWCWYSTENPLTSRAKMEIRSVLSTTVKTGAIHLMLSFYYQWMETFTKQNIIHGKIQSTSKRLWRVASYMFCCHSLFVAAAMIDSSFLKTLITFSKSMHLGSVWLFNAFITLFGACAIFHAHKLNQLTLIIWQRIF